MLQSKKIKLGFTLIELLVVIAIIGVLSTMAIIALGSARAKARDSKRVADIKQISTALELYYADNSNYPTTMTVGGALVSPSGVTYMGSIPSNPTPRNDGDCPSNDYSYIYSTTTNKYSLGFCLGGSFSNFSSGFNMATNEGFFSSVPTRNLSLWLKADSINLNNGDQVAAWSDSGPASRIATAISSTVRPIYKTGVINSKPIVRFDGIDDVLTLSSAINNARTVFFLIKWDGQMTSYVPLLGSLSYYDFHGTASSVYVFDSLYTSAYIKNGLAWNNGVSIDPLSIAKDRSNFQLIEFQTTSDVRTDNISSDRSIPTRNLNGDVAEIIIYDISLSNSERKQVENYLGNKYNLSIVN
ncbi:MAG: prepilin-type N-terminal cleavage/methylation domain-containing protein [Candidatus Falkowbacteria bacterium]|nr:prepilin-type N-terminal cleavage/methylation domain-containing protein [Candidatus Falkowbacteria bacterium]